MAKSLTYEKQASLSLMLAGAGCVLALGALAMVLQNYNPQFGVLYSAGSKRFYAVMGALGLAFLLASGGFYFAFNSAGQKRNKRSGMAWLGFWSSAFVLFLTLSVGVFFQVQKFSVN